MIYKEFKKEKISALGMGCMRFPLTGNDFSQIDIDDTKQLIDYAIKNGINYFDTAWGYHNGRSETVMGEILKDYPRESFYLATKFPGYNKDNMSKVEEIFNEQLRKCQVDYFDFYLFHNVCEQNIDMYLDPQYGIIDYLIEQKKKGRIKYLGFSTHGTLDTMKRFLDTYGQYMEFCQIQLNWLDWKVQSAKDKVELLKEYNLPIWVMEPVRGGKLAKLEAEYVEMLSNVNPKYTVPEWAFRFLQSIPQVVVTLSGMSDMKQLNENITTYAKEQPLDANEIKTLFNVASKMTSKVMLPCTACRYCITDCPMQLNIPQIIELYNEYVYFNGSYLAPMIIKSLPDDKKPSACIGCCKCESVCPQNIKISEMMKDFTERLLNSSK